jgi:UDP-GlcNAc:undecaprenyl-phosphate/decaprenyl-phosphate GlcNAc-1-phosphate transferase
VSFPFNAYLLALAGGFVVTLATLPLWREWCRRIGHVDDPGHRKLHGEPVPLAGGLAVLTGLLVPVLLGAAALLVAGRTFSFDPPSELISNVGVELPRPLAFDAALMSAFGYGLGARAYQLAAIFAGAVGMVVLGWLDDRHELKAGPKFAGQFLIAAGVAAAGVRITLFIPSEVFSYAVTILWMLTLINAFNFMDNMNGLCTGLGAIAAWCFALAAGVQGQYLVTALALLMTGALLGFLPYNFPKASAFLGDAGSHLVGYLLAVMAILPHFYSETHPNRLAVISPLLILAIPLADMAWVVWLRTSRRQPFWIGDTNHLSHRLERRGLTKTGAVLVIWLLAAAAGATALML